MDYDKLIAPAAEAMRPSGIRKFFDLAAEMPECISLGVGGSVNRLRTAENFFLPLPLATASSRARNSRLVAYRAA